MNKKIFIIGVLVIIIIGIFIFFRIKLNEEKETKIISYYNNPIIPKGFHTVDTETAKWTKKENGSIKDWNKGLVIEDENGNQFVWIPVKKEDLSVDIDKLVKDFVNMKEITRTMLVSLVDKIEISENKEITIYYKFNILNMGKEDNKLQNVG